MDLRELQKLQLGDRASAGLSNYPMMDAMNAYDPRTADLGGQPSLMTPESAATRQTGRTQEEVDSAFPGWLRGMAGGQEVLNAGLGVGTPGGLGAMAQGARRKARQPMAPEISQDLVTRAKAGDEQAKVSLLNQYDPFVAWVAERLSSSATGAMKGVMGEGLPQKVDSATSEVTQLGAGYHPDLQSVGRTAILKAIEKYDAAQPSKKTGQPVDFFTFLSQAVRNDMLQAVSQGGTVPRDYRDRTNINQISRITESLKAAGIEPTDEAIAAQMPTKMGRFSPQRVAKLRELGAQRNESLAKPITVEASPGETDITVGDLIEDPRAQSGYSRTVVEELIGKLAPKQQIVRDVISQGHGIMSDPETLQKYGLSTPQAAKKSYDRGIAQLKKQLEAAGIMPSQVFGEEPTGVQGTDSEIAARIKARRMENPNIPDWRKKAQEKFPEGEPDTVGAEAFDPMKYGQQLQLGNYEQLQELKNRLAGLELLTQQGKRETNFR